MYQRGRLTESASEMISRIRDPIKNAFCSLCVRTQLFINIYIYIGTCLKIFSPFPFSLHYHTNHPFFNIRTGVVLSVSAPA